MLSIVMLVTCGLALPLPSALAAPITFFHQGTGAGTIAGIPFGATTYSITAVADTANRLPTPTGFFINHSSASVGIAGVGNFVFTSPTRTFVNNALQLVGFALAVVGGPETGRIRGPVDPLFTTWNMLESIGPVGGSVTLFQWGTPFAPVFTSGGELLFDSATTAGTFTASAVPEPASLTLLGLGVAGADLVRRSRRRNTRMKRWLRRIVAA